MMEVDRFGAAVGDAGGVEVGQHLLAPRLEGAAEPRDLGDRAGRKAVQHLWQIVRPVSAPAW
jgi:hypothetical protein